MLVVGWTMWLLICFLTIIPALGQTCGNHLQVASSYWVESDSYPIGHYWDQVSQLQGAHFDSPHYNLLNTSSTKAILDIQSQVYDTACNILPNAHSNLVALRQTLVNAGVINKILALYLSDEPYIHGCHRLVLEKSIQMINSVFPGVPTYITFARHCFDPAYNDPVCLSPANRGIPHGLDWIGFDWYMDSTSMCGSGIWDQFACRITAGVERVRKLSPNQKIMLIPDCLTLSNGEAVLIELVHLYYLLGRSNPNVIGLDFFLWSNVPNQFNGLVSLPTLKATASSIGRQVHKECGRSYDLVPIYQYTLDQKDIYYNPWIWEGYEGSGFSPQGVVFGLFNTSRTGNAVLFYECYIQQQDAYNHWLTKSSTCDGLPHQGTPTVIGKVLEKQEENTVPLWRYCAIAHPWYHLYTTFSGALPGMIKESVVAYVVPSNLL